MLRALFEKTGNAAYISHLDLMRLFQRSFKRAGLPLTHTKGFNPRPSVSIALPLSLGVESNCELLDFELEGETVSCQEIKDRLNDALVEGVRVLAVYENGRKIRELELLRCQVQLEYDAGVPEDCLDAIEELFKRESLVVPKKSKNGPTEQDIIPMIKELTVTAMDGNTIVMDAVVCCQNPSLSPMQLAAAVDIFLPDRKPDFAKSRRIELLDANRTIFR